MQSQSARLYLERSGLLPTRSTIHRPTLDVRALPALCTFVVPSVEAQLDTEDYNSPDRAGISGAWPSQEVRVDVP